MTSSLFSPSWYRVASLRPRLRSHVQIHRHHYRGELWYVLQDHSSGRMQRFTPAVHLLIGLMDGKRTVQEIWEIARSRLKDEAPTQDEVIRLLSQLHALDVLQTDVVPDPAEMLKRFDRRRYSKWKQNLRSPLALRFPLLDPDRLLTRFQGWGRILLSWPAFVIWVVTIGAALFQAAIHWHELTQDIADRILAPQNLFLLWLVFPFLKIFHELGHAVAIKRRGGEVHEIGIMLLVFTPIPYVDASSASAFREKRDRILVGAAGMAVEAFFAALALFVWVNIQPGVVRSVAYNMIFVGGVSALFFNGNPLLRYDAYYILADLLEIPNLGPRSNQYLGYLVQRYLFGVKDAEEPVAGRGERFWFVLYSLSSFAYRIFIYLKIIIFIASKYLVMGVLFGGWAAFTLIVMPLAKGLRFLFSSPKLDRRRFRAFAVSGLAVAALVLLVCFLPIPLSTTTEGILWIPEESFVRAGTDGFVERLVATPGESVRRGDALIECSDPLLPAQIKVLEAQLREAEATYDIELRNNRVKAEITKEEIRLLQAKLEEARRRREELTIRSSADGTFAVPMAQDLPGRFLRRGELLGYVLNPSQVTARVVVSQRDVDFVRSRTQGIQVRLPENIWAVLPASLQREVPAATDELPGKALGHEGGGEIPIDPRDRLGLKAFQKIFLFDIVLLSYPGHYNVGGRVYVRFDHGKEPLIWRWYRGVRQLFLRKFNV
jgi:putative peptide zinc metalloprotease protein